MSFKLSNSNPFKEKWKMGRIAASIGIGILLYVVVGFGGCLVRVVSNSGNWIEKDTPASPLNSYTQEAVIAFFAVIAIGIFSAVSGATRP